MRFWRWLFLPAMLGALYGCGFEAPPPVRTPAPPTPVPPLSRLSATLTIPAAQLARLLNNMTAYQIANLRDQPVKCGIGACHLDLSANRTAPATVTAEDGALTVRLPFALKTQMATTGIFAFLHAQGDGQGVATARVSLSISPDLQLASSSSGTVTLDDAHLRAGPVTMNVAHVFDDNQQNLTRPLWQMLDTRVAQFPLRARIAALWSQAFTPLRIGKAPVSWLVLRPQQLAVAQPRIEGGAVAIAIALTAQGQVVVQDAPPANAPTALPRAVPLAAPSNDFSFAVPVLLPYDRAAQLAMASLAKKPPQAGGLTVRFNAIQILPSGRDVVVTVKLCADPHWDWLGWFASCGTVYLRGTPLFDAAHDTVRIAGLHYDIASANLMLTALHALAGDTLAQSLQSHLVFDESRQIARLENQLTQVLARPQGDELTIAAQVETFGTPTFTWTDKGFLALFSAHGQVQARLNL